MDNEQVKIILQKYLADTATDEEKALLETWYIRKHDITPFNLSEVELEDELNKIWEALEDEYVAPRRSLWPRIAAAASIILCLGFGYYFYSHNKTTSNSTQSAKTNIGPGGNKAVLTLANGKQIILTNAQNGKLAVQGTAIINKTSGGQIVYGTAKATGGQNLEKIVYNTMTTPRGGTWTLTLSDGTKVWLNSVSSIKYPTVFTGKDRKVEITGEAYFEVAHNKHMPFYVTGGGQTVEVLGTHFNINAYPEESAVKTTLLEGSVRLFKNTTAGIAHSAILKPGQQGLVTAQMKVIDNANIDQVMAWKNGLFSFEKVPLQEVLRQLSRWYDVEVVYQGNIEPRKFGGEIGRDLNLAEVLNGLKATGIHFSIEGRRLIVMP